jgi:hypothetical protein
MRAGRFAGCALTLIGVLLLSACQEPVTYGSRVTIGAGDRSLDARDPQAVDDAQRQESPGPGEADQRAAGDPRR